MIAEYTDQHLAAAVGKLLEHQGLTLSCAESCTGGLIASRITDVPGSSTYFQYGVVTYSNWAKEHFLKVNPQTLHQYGAVSGETAREMVQGVKAIGQTDLALAVTGIAGPGGGSPQKPVGLVYIAVAQHERVICREFRFLGTRAEIKEQTADQALFLVKSLLEGAITP